MQGKLLDLLKRLNYTKPEDIVAFSKSFLKIDEIQSIETLTNSFTTKRGELQHYLSNAGIVLEAEKAGVSKETLAVSNIHSNFTTPAISTLFNTLHVAEQYFEQSSNNLIMSAVYIGNPDSERYPSSSADLNNNINTLKNNLFKTIVDYLIDKNKLNKADYYETKQ
jgi:paraquat-inducible protein B